MADDPPSTTLPKSVSHSTEASENPLPTKAAAKIAAGIAVGRYLSNRLRTWMQQRSCTMNTIRAPVQSTIRHPFPKPYASRCPPRRG